MKLIILILMVFLYLSELIYCQEIKSTDFANTIGIKHSNTTGYGAFYNRRLSENISIQFLAMYFYYFRQTDELEHKNINYSLGTELQRNIIRNENYRVYFLMGGYYYFDDDYKDYQNSQTLTIFNNSYNVAIGVAFEYQYKRFIFSAEIGYKFYEDNKTITELDKNPYPVLYRETKLAGGLTVGFIF
ncbi:MAG: hypothetical protein KIT33_02340 [Candidatus Kapabacteria bacterium]|nr:hypothetical protein [Ignavibacteriota bacterium]MCW5883789.1 hypothetical protein [Candidatus Kapabacteria bacterium]